MPLASSCHCVSQGSLGPTRPAPDSLPSALFFFFIIIRRGLLACFYFSQVSPAPPSPVCSFSSWSSWVTFLLLFSAKFFFSLWVILIHFVFRKVCPSRPSSPALFLAFFFLPALIFRKPSQSRLLYFFLGFIIAFIASFLLLFS